MNVYKAITDTVTPALRFVVSSIYKLKGGELYPGDTVFVEGKMINYLHPSSDIRVSITNSSGYIKAIDKEIDIEPLAMLDTSDIKTIRVVLSHSIPFDVKIDVLLDFQGNKYSDFHFVSFYANPSLVTLEENNIKHSVTSSGSVGYIYTGNTFNGYGFSYKNQKLLASGTLVLANSSQQMIINRDLNNNYVTNSTPSLTIEGNQLIVTSDYTGRYDASIDFNFTVHQKASVWRGDSSFVLYEYDIINSSMAKVENLNVGLFVDWDIDNPFSDIASVDTSLDYCVVSSVDRDKPYAGIKLISTDDINHFLIERDDDSDTNIIVRDGISDSEIFYCMTHSKTKPYVSNYIGTDMFQVINVSNKTLEINDTIHFAAVFFATNKQEHIVPIIKRATKLYETQYELRNRLISNKSKIGISIFPNPTNGNSLNLVVETQQAGIYTVSIKDLEGRISQKELYEILPGGKTLTLKGIYQPGYYLVTIQSETICETIGFLKE